MGEIVEDHLSKTFITWPKDSLINCFGSAVTKFTSFNEAKPVLDYTKCVYGIKTTIKAQTMRNEKARNSHLSLASLSK